MKHIKALFYSFNSVSGKKSLKNDTFSCTCQNLVPTLTVYLSLIMRTFSLSVRTV